MPRTIRQIRVDGKIAYVPLTRGYVSIIDSEDVPLIDGYNWCAQIGRNTVYAVRCVRNGVVVKKVIMHKEIMEPVEGFEVDHIDKNGLNNRRENLRKATAAQNQHNQRKARHNTSGFKGVSFCADRQLWQSQIQTDGKRKFLGRFSSAEMAFDAYCRASALLHGEFGSVE